MVVAGAGAPGDQTGVIPKTTDPAKPWLAVAERCPHQKLVALYHELLPTLDRVARWDDRRQAFSRGRWREVAIERRWRDEEEGLRYFARFFRYVATCPHLMGKSPPQTPGGPPFQATLEWLLRPTNFVKVVEGFYAPKERT